MTPDEAAKAEAESIATRWVPAHMTARQGMVDDIARALVTGRRLVEEAQAERDIASRAHIDAQGQRDRVSDALGEMNELVIRLKGELAEARDEIDRQRSILALAAAVQGPPEGERFILSTSTTTRAAPPAEQAQGEGALTLEMLDEVLRDHINDEYDRSTELAKRVEGHETSIASLRQVVTELGRRTPAPPPPEAAGPTCGKLIGSLNAPCTKMRNHSDGNCEHDTRKAAGPGHAFVDCSGYELCMTIGCHFDVVGGKHCGLSREDHAVPPIPEGK